MSNRACDWLRQRRVWFPEVEDAGFGTGSGRQQIIGY
jgi:hypothetical protein